MKLLFLPFLLFVLGAQMSVVLGQGGPNGGQPPKVTTAPQILVPGNTIYKLNFTSNQRPDFLTQNHLAALTAIAFTAGPLPPANVSWLGVTAVHTTDPTVVWSQGSVEIQVKNCPAPPRIPCRNSTDLKFWLDLDFNQRLEVHGVVKGSWSVRAPPGSHEPPITTTLAPGHLLDTVDGPNGGDGNPPRGDESPNDDGRPPLQPGDSPSEARPPKPHLRVQAQITTTLSLEEAQTEAKQTEIRQDIAEACNVPTENVTITGIRAGSVIVEFEIETTNYDNDTELLSQLMNATQTGDMSTYTTGNQTVTILVTVIVNQTPSPVLIVERENTTAIALVIAVGLLLVVVVIIASAIMVMTIKKQGKRSRTKRVIVTPVEEFEDDSNEDAEQNPIAGAPAATVVGAQPVAGPPGAAQQQQLIMMQQQMMMMQQQAQLQALQHHQQQLQQSSSSNNNASGVSPTQVKNTSGGGAYYGMSSSSGSGSNTNMNSFGSNGFNSNHS